MFFVGIDLGTSSVKTLLMDEKGVIQRIISKTYPIYQEIDGWSEQEPEDWLNGSVQAIKELIEGFDPNDIKAVSFAGQMHGLVCLDKDDKVLRRAILWNDQRTQTQCDYLNETIGTDVLLAQTANIALTGFTAPKILWMKDNEPELFAKIAKIMLPKDFLAYRFTGVHASDDSDNSGTLLFDVKNRKWDKKMIDIVGIKEEMLPKALRSFDVIGKITGQMAAATGLSAETSVIIGGGDNAVGAVSTGTLADNDCLISLGTSGVIFFASDRYYEFTQPVSVHEFRHATGGYHMMGVTLSASASLNWWIEDILETKNYDEELTNLPVHNKLYFLPYLSGERTPHRDPFARGAFVGMSTTTSRADMTLAVLEGVTFSLLDVMNECGSCGLKTESARIIGGGSRSAFWCQLISDILGIKIEKINCEEGPAFGAAILASVGYGLFETVGEACAAFVKSTNVYYPNMERHGEYSAKYRTYRDLYKSLKEIYKSL